MCSCQSCTLIVLPMVKQPVQQHSGAQVWHLHSQLPGPCAVAVGDDNACICAALVVMACTEYTPLRNACQCQQNEPYYRTLHRRPSFAWLSGATLHHLHATAMV